MTALQTPAADAPAEEWGRLAVAIPGWRWPWACLDVLPGYVCLDGEWCHTDDVRVSSELIIEGRVCQIPACPDPDHWAWEGWLLRMLGDTFAHTSTEGEGYVVCIIVDGDTIEGTGRTLGRACIAAAAAHGRWPGGGE